MAMVRINITIPEDLARQLDKLAGPRKKSRFIAETLRAHIKKKEQDELERALEEGYKATRQQTASIAKDFEAADLEGWHEY